jgi:hypothetical protein
MFRYPPQVIALVVMKICCDLHKYSFEDESILGKELMELYINKKEYLLQAENDFKSIPEFKKPDE